MTAKPELLVTVFSDYICPFCYIGSVRLDALREQFDLRVNWMALEIHPDNPAHGRPVEELGYPPEQWRQMMDALYRMARAEGLHVAERSFTTNSHKALLLAEASKEEGKEVFYRLHNRLFEAYFGERRNIGDAAILRNLARETGVPDETLTRAWTEERYEQRLEANRAAAARLHVSATPTYVIGKRVLVGAVPTTVLRDAATHAQEG
jgi:predicted DsbA family dithiol-disulfide isomerase